MQQKVKSGFSKLSKKEKMRWVAEQYFQDPEEAMRAMECFWQSDEALQRVLDGFSENTISNYLMPYGVAPNFLVNGRTYAVPMVIEESSVVAAASSAAKFWMKRGGFQAEVIATKKIGQVHFSWAGHIDKLYDVFEVLKQRLRAEAAPLTSNMEKRGGGVQDIELLDMSEKEDNYYQLFVTFETCDSMGANFINSVLESFGQTLEQFVATHPAFEGDSRQLTVIMAILSNYTPECRVRSWVSCPVQELEGACETMAPTDFAERFRRAVRIAEIDAHRAATHNKGIFNGIDAVVLATGNDFRAVEACGHTYAAQNGQYSSLSTCRIEEGIFTFELELPLALGTVGGLTKLHPMARCSLEMLDNPSASELMMIVAATGLAQNFAALRSLVTTGIQKGHMKMHLHNILNHLGADSAEIRRAESHFENEVVSFNAVRAFLNSTASTQDGAAEKN